MTGAPPAFDCQTCGACCRSNEARRDGVVGWVTGVEEDRLREISKLLVRRVRPAPAFDPEAGLAADTNGRCRALAGRIGQRVTCMIYVDRPRICSSFTPGATACLLSREEARIR